MHERVKVGLPSESRLHICIDRLQARVLIPRCFPITLGCPGTHGSLLHDVSPGVSGLRAGDEVYPLRPGLVNQISTGSKWGYLFSMCWAALLDHRFLDHQRCHHGFLRPLPPQWDEIRDRPGCVFGLRSGLPQLDWRTGAVLEQQR